MTPPESAFTDTLISRTVRERIVLVGVARPPATLVETDASLDELARLVETAGAEVAERVLQRRDAPDPATYLGRGKVEDRYARSAWQSMPTPWSSTTISRRHSSATSSRSSVGPPSTAPR